MRYRTTAMDHARILESSRNVSITIQSKLDWSGKLLRALEKASGDMKLSYDVKHRQPEALRTVPKFLRASSCFEPPNGTTRRGQSSNNTIIREFHVSSI